MNESVRVREREREREREKKTVSTGSCGANKGAKRKKNVHTPS